MTPERDVSAAITGPRNVARAADIPRPSESEWQAFLKARREMYQRVLSPLLVETEELTPFEKNLSKDLVFFDGYCRYQQKRGKTPAFDGTKLVWILERVKETKHE